MPDAARLAELVFKRAELEEVPEMPITASLRTDGASGLEVRRFLTFVCAMDYFRDSTRLWRDGKALFGERPDMFDPAAVSRMPLDALRDELKRSRVSQRHGVDSNAWRRTAENLHAHAGHDAVARLVETGEGDAVDALRDLVRCGYLNLRGPKISRMWVRMMAYPGGARVARMDSVPVAVDVHVRRVSENLGVAETRGMALDAARPLIQQAWRVATARADFGGPPGIENTSAALDPALWWFGQNGCSPCERQGYRTPLSPACDSCRLPEKP